MYIFGPSSSASSLLRASRARFGSSLASAVAAPTSSRITPSVSQYTPLSYSAAARSLHCSVPRWSHGVAWRLPLSLRAQSRVVSPFIERLQRKMSTIGNLILSWWLSSELEFVLFQLDQLLFIISREDLITDLILNCSGISTNFDPCTKWVSWWLNEFHISRPRA